MYIRKNKNFCEWVLKNRPPPLPFVVGLWQKFNIVVAFLTGLSLSCRVNLIFANKKRKKCKQIKIQKAKKITTKLVPQNKLQKNQKFLFES